MSRNPNAANQVGTTAVPTRTPTIYGGLAIGVVATSFAAILIRLTDAPPLVIGAYRLTIASLCLTPWALALRRQEMAGMTARDWLLACASGAFLGLHFAFWISSLQHTTVASSVVLVSTNPLFVGLASHFLLRERVETSMWLGIVVSILGAAIVGLGDRGSGQHALRGDIYALLGAVAGSAYFLIGRSLRRRLSNLSYVLPTYWTAALVLTAMAMVAGNRLVGYTGRTLAMFLALGIVPQVIGHSMLNWALGHLPPTLVAIAILAEPISSSLLAMLILREAPSMVRIVGGLLILVGIYVSLRGPLPTILRRPQQP